MNRTLARERLTVFVSSRVPVSTIGAAPFLGQHLPVSVGFQYPDGKSDWFTDAEELGAVMAADAGFRAMQLGTWLNTPDGAFISEAVGQVLPPDYRPEFQLVVDALKYAATCQQRAGIQRALGVGVLTGVGALILWLLGGD